MSVRWPATGHEISRLEPHEARGWPGALLRLSPSPRSGTLLPYANIVIRSAMRIRSVSTLLSLLAVALLSACSPQPESGHVLDEARAAGRNVTSFPHAGEDYFHDMDN